MAWFPQLRQAALGPTWRLLGLRREGRGRVRRENGRPTAVYAEKRVRRVEGH